MIKNKQLFAGLTLKLLATVAYAADLPEPPEKTRLLAADYEHGREGVKQNYKQAFALYCQAALQGDAESAYSLGFMYFNGRGVPRDLGVAMRWFKQAAEAGDKQSQNMLVRFAGVAPIADTGCKPVVPVFQKAVETSPDRQKVAGWVNEIAPVYGIDPQLIMAVIRAESAFNPEAVSGKNAQGLMQLIPETAERFGVKDSWNPIQNIHGGAAYLHWLLRHFDGKVDLVLAAYNAGEQTVDRYKGIPPYLETQNYVKLIQTWYPNTTHPVPPKALEKIVRPEQKS